MCVLSDVALCASAKPCVCIVAALLHLLKSTEPRSEALPSCLVACSSSQSLAPSWLMLQRTLVKGAWCGCSSLLQVSLALAHACAQAS